jgi:hypothetical protein
MYTGKKDGVKISHEVRSDPPAGSWQNHRRQDQPHIPVPVGQQMLGRHELKPVYPCHLN